MIDRWFILGLLAAGIAGLYWFSRHPKPYTPDPPADGPRRSLRWGSDFFRAERN